MKSGFAKAAEKAAFLIFLSLSVFVISCGGSRNIDFEERERILRANYPDFVNQDKKQEALASASVYAGVATTLTRGQLLVAKVSVSSVSESDPTVAFRSSTQFFMKLSDQKLVRSTDMALLGQVTCVPNSRPQEVLCEKLDVKVSFSEFSNETGSSFRPEGEVGFGFELKSRPFEILGSFNSEPQVSLGSFQLLKKNYSVQGTATTSFEIFNLTQTAPTNLVLYFEIPVNHPSWLDEVSSGSWLEVPLVVQGRWAVQEFTKPTVQMDAQSNLYATYSLIQLDTLQPRTFQVEIRPPQ